MDIASALDKLVALEESLSINEPINARIKKAFKYAPSIDTSLLGFAPCFINEWTLRDETRGVSLHEEIYEVRIQLFAYDANYNQAADVATRFHVAFVEKLRTAQTLNQTVASHSMRGGNPTLVALTRGHESFMGLDFFLDLQLVTPTDFTDVDLG